ncbi:acyl-CoA dehydrogenase family protein [Streptomyces oceani]|uniref:Acyl-CoA dehydrogenase n=1 Tax=Streptomyces oceani TaxID=1075402 RepID=A0A1E7KKT6_9ACTN|nr:acyl-CoA dehydrogenase family protein [Streptomyces oceani]OEV04555.1 acyl-CoA dehydrogenase [Streptomyces oceani]
MDFSLGEELEAVRDLARTIFTDRATPERLREVETSDTRFDERLWHDLARAELLGTALPEGVGGAGLGMAALCVLLEEQGRRVAPVPVWPAVLGALAVATHGTAEQRTGLLPAAAEGSARLTLALEEFAPGDPLAPGTRATAGPRGWSLSGTKAVVPSPSGAGRVLVTADTEAGTGLFLLAPDATGTDWERADTTSHELSAQLTLTDAPAEAVGAPGSGVVEWLVARAGVALAAVQLGVAEGALRHAADYLGEREQFGRPLATFQAVQHQLADCYIDIEAMRVTLWQAVTALADADTGDTDTSATGVPDAPDAPDAPDSAADGQRAALVAKWWATEGGLDVVHRVQHVHGGMGVDLDYPVHRHFLWGKQISTTLGGSGADLARLGAVLAGGEAAP